MSTTTLQWFLLTVVRREGSTGVMLVDPELVVPEVSGNLLCKPSVVRRFVLHERVSTVRSTGQ